MTPKQKTLLDYITAFWDVHGYAPSCQEMADGIGCKSKSEINRLVEELWWQGEIEYTPYKARSVRVKCPMAFLQSKGLMEEYREWRQ